MRLGDILKNLFSKAEKSHTEKVTTSNAKKRVTYHFTRDDGSTFSLTPVLDERGMQAYEEFPNNIKIPKFDFLSLGHYAPGHIFGKEFLIDINPNWLSDDNYKHVIANLLLPKSRISKIITDYCNYAGGLRLDQAGNIQGKYIDPNIIRILEQRKRDLEIAQAWQKKNDFYEELREKTPHLKPDHAVPLSPELRDQLYGRSHGGHGGR